VNTASQFHRLLKADKYRAKRTKNTLQGLKPALILRHFDASEAVLFQDGKFFRNLLSRVEEYVSVQGRRTS
jgi:hypothetical protein